jgi:hypothetical protein
VSDSVVLTRLAALWARLIATCKALALHGYERTAIAATLPLFHQHILNDRCNYLYERCMKRVSPEWQQTEPAEVVLLCHTLVRCYDDIIAIATGAPTGLPPHTLPRKATPSKHRTKSTGNGSGSGIGNSSSK